MKILDNIKKIFERNARKSTPKLNKASVEFICRDKEFGAEQIMKLIAFVNGINSKYGNINMPIYLFFGNVEIIDKLSYILLECICYSLIKDYRHAVAISWQPKNNILTQGVFSSPLKLINGNAARLSPKFIEKFKSEIYFYHFRKVISEDKTDTNYLGSLQQDIYNFLSTFYIEEEYKDDIVEMIGEIVGNAIEHAQSQCLLDIDVTTDHSKCIETETQDGNFYGINIVILNFSDVLFGDRLKQRLQKDELNTDDRYTILKKAYLNHQKYFSDEYMLDDFCNMASIQHKISGDTNKGRAGGRGLTTLIKSLQDKSDTDKCYVLSGKRIIFFEKELLEYDADEWLGLNKEKDFINNIPDEGVVHKCLVDFPGTAYNLNFVLKREVGRVNEDCRINI